MHMALSVVLATYNEEKNIKDCLSSIKNIADEVVVVDGSSTDKTVQIAQSLGARVVVTDNPTMFHINKQKALQQAQGDWILQLDADERVSKELAEEIKRVIAMSEVEIEVYEKNLKEKELFEKHTQLVLSDVILGLDPGIHAFFIPRLNYFLGKFLRYGGVYPDGVIRLVKKGKGSFPCKDVHELMEIEGKVGWLEHPLLHYDSPTFKRYLERNSGYIDFEVEELSLNIKNSTQNKKMNMFHVTCYMFYVFLAWMFVKPISWFFMTTFRHKGILDGWQGVVFSFFSALRCPRAYIRYQKTQKK